MDPFEAVLKVLRDEKKKAGQLFGISKEQERSLITQVRYGAQHQLLKRLITKVEKLQEYNQEEKNGSK